MVETGVDHTVRFTGTPPSEMRFGLRADAGQPGVKVLIPYPNAGVYEVMADGDKVPPMPFNDTLGHPEQLTKLTCGENRFQNLGNWLEIYITPGCEIHIKPLDSIIGAVRMDWTMDEFWNDGGVTSFADRLASILGVHPSQVRTVQVYEGSVVLIWALTELTQEAIKEIVEATPVGEAPELPVFDKAATSQMLRAAVEDPDTLEAMFPAPALGVQDDDGLLIDVPGFLPIPPPPDAEWPEALFGSRTYDEDKERVEGTDNKDSIRPKNKKIEYTILGGDGHDKIYGGHKDDDILGNEGKDYIRGGKGDDRLSGGEGEDKIYGDHGDDLIHGGAGDDKLYGRRGNDTIDGYTGEDTIDGGVGNDILSGGFDDDTIRGGSGHDEINGDEGEDKLYGGSGNDVMDGGIGNDTLKGDSGSDLMFGGAGNDHIDGGSADDNIDGGFGNDTLIGNFGDDTIYGGPGDDKLYGGVGDDHLYGGPGNDVLDGGTGDDVLVDTEGDNEFHGGAIWENTSWEGGSGADKYFISGIWYNRKPYGKIIVNVSINDTFYFRTAKTCANWTTMSAEDDILPVLAE